MYKGSSLGAPTFGQEQVDDALEELANERLVDRKQFQGPNPGPGTSYDYFFTRLGREFLKYRGPARS